MLILAPTLYYWGEWKNGERPDILPTDVECLVFPQRSGPNFDVFTIQPAQIINLIRVTNIEPIYGGKISRVYFSDNERMTISTPFEEVCEALAANITELGGALE